LAYQVSGNLWFPTALHFAWNFCQGVVFQLPVSGIRTDGLIDVWVAPTAPLWLTGGAFGLEGSALITGTQGLLIFLLRWWAARERSGDGGRPGQAPQAPQSGEESTCTC